MDSQAVKLFCSYSHKDDELRVELEKHLMPLRRQGLLDSWSDRRILAGDEWAGEIDSSLDEADIIVLLISANFINSDYCYNKEMPRAIERHDADEARVIPVIVRPVYWRNTPFAKLNPLPRDAKPVVMWEIRDEAWEHVTEEVLKACEAVKSSQPVAVAAPTLQHERLEVSVEGASVHLLDPSAETVRQIAKVRDLQVDTLTCAGDYSSNVKDTPTGGLLTDRRKIVDSRGTQRSIESVLRMMEEAGAESGRAVEEVEAGGVYISRVELLLKQSILLHTDAEEVRLDENLPEDVRHDAYIAKLREAYDLLSEANRLDPVNTEVLLKMAELAAELTPEDPNDEQRLLNRVRKLLDEPKNDVEHFRLARATYMLAMTSKPPRAELLREPRAVFERLGRLEWVRQCDEMLRHSGAEAAPAEEPFTPEAADGEPHLRTDRSEAQPSSSRPRTGRGKLPRRVAQSETTRDDHGGGSAFQPVGEWQMRAGDAVGSTIYASFSQDSSCEGAQIMPHLGATLRFTGRWSYEPLQGRLQIQGFLDMGGNPQPFMFGVSITGPQGEGFHGIGTDGYPYFISRIDEETDEDMADDVADDVDELDDPQSQDILNNLLGNLYDGER